MRKTTILFAAFFILFTPVHPCTTFILKTQNGLYFGRNLDWVSSHGMIVINKRGVNKESLVFPPEKNLAWTSKYGSISFNQFGKEFPYGGINEKGLVIEIMVSQAEYEPQDERPVVNELQWVQYQLDNCASVKEVLATNNMVRIGQTHESLHYLICDTEGNTAIIEFIEGKMVTHKGNDLSVSVLENDLYSESLENYKEEKSCRFTKAVNLVKDYKGTAGQQAVDYCYEILDKVALSAEWSIVYDITNREIHFSTTQNREVRKIKMSAFDFTCNDQSEYYDLSREDLGEVASKFMSLKFNTNTEVLNKALEINNVLMESHQRDMVADYFKLPKCN